MKISFSEIFQIEGGVFLEIKKPIRVGGVTFEPMTMEGTYLGGVDWKAFEGNDLKIHTDGEVVVIEGIY